MAIAASKLPNQALPKLLVGSIAIGVGVGAVLFLSSLVVYLILFSPLAAAVVASLLYSGLVHNARARAVPVVIGFAIVTGVTAYAAFRGGEYLHFLYESRNDILDESSRADWMQVVDDYLFEETGSTGWVGFIKLQSDYGMDVSSTRSYDNSSSHWGPTITTLYWLVELGMMIGFTVALGFGQAVAPFCEANRDWLQMRVAGYVDRSKADQFLGLVKKGDMAQASTLMQAKVPRGNHVEVKKGRCDEFSEGNLELEYKAGRNSKTVGKGKLDPDAYKLLTAAEQE